MCYNRNNNMQLYEKTYSKTENVFTFELFIATHKYEVRMNSNDNE